jgi:tripartite-type tricarboxylate transporter receptor subunit TctC
MKNLVRFLVVAVLILSSAVAALADTQPFYEGKTIRIIVPHGAGGGFDTYARMIKPYLEKYLPGSKVIVDNISGAGGEIGRNLAFTAKPDGYTICLTEGHAMVFNTLAESESVRYKIDKWTYLARITAEPSILTASTKSRFDSFEEIVNVNKKLFFSTSGVGDADYFALGVVAHVFDFEIIPVTGYAGSQEASMAAVRGEVDLWQPSLGTALPLIKNGDVKAMVVYGLKREPELPEVPTLVEIANDDNFGLGETDKKIIKAIISINEVRRIIVAPPGLDEGKTEILRKAVKKALHDPELIAHSKQMNRPIIYLEGEKIAQLISETMEIKDLIKPILDETLKLAQ